MVGAPVAPCLASYGGQELRPAVSCQRRKSKKKRKGKRKENFPSIHHFPKQAVGEGICRYQIPKTWSMQARGKEVRKPD